MLSKIGIQDQCAKELGISRGALSYYENGERKRLAMYYMRTRVIVYLVENKLNFSINEVDYERALAKLALFEVGQVANLIAEDFKSPHFDEAAGKIEKLKAEFKKEESANAQHNPKKE